MAGLTRNPDRQFSLEIEPLINQFGYLAILLGSVIEGEAVLLLGGFFAQQGFLSLPVVVLLGVIGTYCSEAALYHLGLSKGPALMRRSPRWLAGYERFALRLHRHKYLLIIGYRFFYGMRSIAPLAIGASGIQPALFHSLNLIGTVIWTLALATLGFFFGRTIGHFLENIGGVGLWIPAALLALVLIVRVANRSKRSTPCPVTGADNDEVLANGSFHER
jgi:membrane protein DedA with SNARE-associated domain